jgi:hypothetical protein
VSAQHPRSGAYADTAGRTERRVGGQVAGSVERTGMEEWENGQDAARQGGAVPDAIDARVSLTFGDQAEVVTHWHPVSDPLRVPAARLADDLGVPVERLPGVRFRARIVGEDVQVV